MRREFPWPFTQARVKSSILTDDILAHFVRAYEQQNSMGQASVSLASVRIIKQQGSVLQLAATCHRLHKNSKSVQGNDTILQKYGLDHQT